MENQGLGMGQVPRPAETVGLAESGPAAKCLSGGFTYPPGSQPLPGYTIKRGIGHGGFGEVYYATSDAGKEVALKLIRRNLEIELRGLRQCLNLKHPNLLNIYDIRQDGQENYWVIMEYVAGPSLQERIAASANGLSESEILRWMQGIVAGVGYLHEHGIVHRDLKPANIFCEEGVVKIGDYGLSKFISSSRRSGQTESVGTVHYMAPEVANGRYGKEIDIYVFGVILYEMLTGRVPFEGESAAEVLMKHLTAQPDVSMLAEPYRSVVARALEKDPANRFGSMVQMWETLRPAGDSARNGNGGLGAAAMVQLAEASEGVAEDAGGGVSADASVAVGAPGMATSPASPQPFRQKLQTWPAQILQAWNSWRLNTPMKLVLVGLGVFAFLATAHILLPLAAVGLLGYIVYGLGRKMFAHSAEKQVGGGSASLSHAAPIRPEVQGRPGRLPGWPLPPSRAGPYEQAAYALIWKPNLERITELLGSLLIGAMVSLVMCLVIVVLYSFRQEGQPLAPEQIAWLAVMGMVGAWAVLMVSKFWEGAAGEPLLRRFVLLVVGLVLGAIGYGLSQWLWVELSTLENFPRPHQYPLPPRFYGPGGEPMLMAFLATFGALLALIRWQRQADPLRFARLNLWSVMVCVFAAAVIAGVFRFPQPWLPMCAGMMSVAIQLAAPWSHPRRRRFYAPVLLMGLMGCGGTFALVTENLKDALGAESTLETPSQPTISAKAAPKTPARSSSSGTKRAALEASSSAPSGEEQEWMTRILREEFRRWLTFRSEALFSQLQTEFERWLALRGSESLSGNSSQQRYPDWVDAPAGVIDGEYWQTVKAGPYAALEDCQAELRNEIQKAVASYAQKRFDASAGYVSWDIESLLPQILADQWQQTRLIEISPTVGRKPMIWLYGRLRFTRQVQEEIYRQYRRAVIDGRLRKLAGGMAGLLLLLGMSYGVLRLQCNRLYPQRVC